MPEPHAVAIVLLALEHHTALSTLMIRDRRALDDAADLVSVVAVGSQVWVYVGTKSWGVTVTEEVREAAREHVRREQQAAYARRVAEAA